MSWFTHCCPVVKGTVTVSAAVSTSAQGGAFPCHCFAAPVQTSTRPKQANSALDCCEGDRSSLRYLKGSWLPPRVLMHCPSRTVLKGTLKCLIVTLHVYIWFWQNYNFVLFNDCCWVFWSLGTSRIHSSHLGNRKFRTWGWRGGLSGKGTCYQAWRAEFHP